MSNILDIDEFEKQRRAVIRDSFAMYAIFSVVQSALANGDSLSPEDLAKAAYAVADAMLKVREEVR